MAVRLAAARVVSPEYPATEDRSEARAAEAAPIEVADDERAPPDAEDLATPEVPLDLLSPEYPETEARSEARADAIEPLLLLLVEPALPPLRAPLEEELEALLPEPLRLLPPELCESERALPVLPAFDALELLELLLELEPL